MYNKALKERQLSRGMIMEKLTQTYGQWLVPPLHTVHTLLYIYFTDNTIFALA